MPKNTISKAQRKPQDYCIQARQLSEVFGLVPHPKDEDTFGDDAKIFLSFIGASYLLDAILSDQKIYRAAKEAYQDYNSGGDENA